MIRKGMEIWVVSAPVQHPVACQAVDEQRLPLGIPKIPEILICPRKTLTIQTVYAARRRWKVMPPPATQKLAPELQPDGQGRGVSCVGAG